MDNNSRAATPVNVEGFTPGAALDVTITAPLPLPVVIIAPLPLPVVLSPSGFPVKRQSPLSAVLVTQAVISAVPCELAIVAGYNSDPTATDLLYVQLHDASAAIAPGTVPEVVIPVYGGKTPYSYGLELDFAIGLVIALSTTELTFTAPASNWLAFSCVYRTAT